MRRAIVTVVLASCAAPRAHHRSPAVTVAAVGAGAVVGFGAGQALEGEWSTRGWQFGVADSVFVASYVYGMRGLGCINPTRATDCDSLAFSALWVGALGLVGSHLWQACMH